jgi:hypothetical protein
MTGAHVNSKVEPRLQKQQPRGIVIRPGSDPSRKGPFWAYMWTNDEEAAETHWHQLVPVAKSA